MTDVGDPAESGDSAADDALAAAGTPDDRSSHGRWRPEAFHVAGGGSAARAGRSAAAPAADATGPSDALSGTAPVRSVDGAVLRPKSAAESGTASAPVAAGPSGAVAPSLSAGHHDTSSDAGSGRSARGPRAAEEARRALHAARAAARRPESAGAERGARDRTRDAGRRDAERRPRGGGADQSQAAGADPESGPGAAAREALRAARGEGPRAARKPAPAVEPAAVAAPRPRRPAAGVFAGPRGPGSPVLPPVSSGRRRSAADAPGLLAASGTSAVAEARDKARRGPASGVPAAVPVPGTALPEPPTDDACQAPWSGEPRPASVPVSRRQPPPGVPERRRASAFGPSRQPPPGTGDRRPGSPDRPAAMPSAGPPSGRSRSRGGGAHIGAESFADTWWGQAWVRALEAGTPDAARLARGRAYAEEGRVGAVSVTPGRVLAYVRGGRARPYRTQLRLRGLLDKEWDRFLDAAARRPGDIAALLDKDIPRSLADCGADLLPAPGELEPQCGCPDSGRPCKHAAALCYRMARLLDEDPFLLLLMRGRHEHELLEELSRRSSAHAARTVQDPAPFPGLPARDTFARHSGTPLPAPLPVPPGPGHPPVYPASPGGPDPLVLDQLATDAAARAYALLTTGRDPVGGLTLWQDAVRLAAGRTGSGLTTASRGLYASLADAVHRTPAELARAVAAWRQGGEAGLSVLEETWDPPAGRFDRARPALLAAGLPAFRPWHNHLTHPRGHVQIRLGRDHRWYAYESEPGREDWWPGGVPDLGPVAALTGLGAVLDRGSA